MTTKVKARHLDRSAIVYVRQSSLNQVLMRRESALLQRALVDQAIELGWSADRVEVINQDRGTGGQSLEFQLGFRRLLAEVGLDHVGIILGVEMSRFSRISKDWYQLVEVCALFRTLLADQGSVYDPKNHCDRLLLGLKGALSRAELRALKGRLEQAWCKDLGGAQWTKGGRA